MSVKLKQFQGAATVCCVLCQRMFVSVPLPPDDRSHRPSGQSVSQMTQSNSSHMYVHTHTKGRQLQIAAHSSSPAHPLFPSSFHLRSFSYFSTLTSSPTSSLIFSSALWGPVSHPPHFVHPSPSLYFPLRLQLEPLL